VGRLPDGRACFVHRTAPGDRIRARIRQDRARWARATLVEVLEPGPDRRTPHCPLYADCGGCQLQHLTEDAQLRAKGRIVQDALTRIGGLALPECRLHAAPSATAYRNRVTFTLRRLGGGRLVAGFRSLSRPRRLVSVGDQCLLPEPDVLSVWRDLRRNWGPGAARLPRGSELRLTLRGTPQGILLVIRGGREPGRGVDQLLEDTPGLEGIWWVPEPGSAQLLAGRRHLLDRWQGGDLELGPFGFVQVNRAMGERLERLVVEALSPASEGHIVDAYWARAPTARPWWHGERP